MKTAGGGWSAPPGQVDPRPPGTGRTWRAAPRRTALRRRLPRVSWEQRQRTDIKRCSNKTNRLSISPVWSAPRRGLGCSPWTLWGPMFGPLLPSKGAFGPPTSPSSPLRTGTPLVLMPMGTRTGAAPAGRGGRQLVRAESAATPAAAPAEALCSGRRARNQPPGLPGPPGGCGVHPSRNAPSHCPT